MCLTQLSVTKGTIELDALLSPKRNEIKQLSPERIQCKLQILLIYSNNPKKCHVDLERDPTVTPLWCAL